MFTTAVLFMNMTLTVPKSRLVEHISQKADLDYGWKTKASFTISAQLTHRNDEVVFEGIDQHNRKTKMRITGSPEEIAERWIAYTESLDLRQRSMAV